MLEFSNIYFVMSFANFENRKIQNPKTDHLLIFKKFEPCIPSSVVFRSHHAVSFYETMHMNTSALITMYICAVLKYHQIGSCSFSPTRKWNQVHFQVHVWNLLFYYYLFKLWRHGFRSVCYKYKHWYSCHLNHDP